MIAVGSVASTAQGGRAGEEATPGAMLQQSEQCECEREEEGSRKWRTVRVSAELLPRCGWSSGGVYGVRPSRYALASSGQ